MSGCNERIPAAFAAVLLLLTLPACSPSQTTASQLGESQVEATPPSDGGNRGPDISTGSPVGTQGESRDAAAARKTPETKQSKARYDWPSWRGPNRDGTSPETGLIRTFPDAGPKIIWRAKLGSGFSGLSVADGRVFTLFGEDGREKIVCLDADTGDEIWKVDSDADFAQGRSFGPRATPCVDGDRVYAVGASGMVHCLKAASGDRVWRFNVYDKFGMTPHDEGLSCSPQVDGKKLILAAGVSVFAFDKTNGEVTWRALDEKMNHSTPRRTMLDKQVQWVALSASHLVGLDPESGDELWRYPQRAVNCASPVIGPDDQVFAAAAYGFGCQLVKCSGGEAKEVYKNNVLATHHATALLHEGHLYGFHDRPGIFKCVEFNTGKEKWVSRSPGKGKLLIADGQMIVITEYGELLLAPVSPDGFEPTAKARVVKGTCYTAPTLAGGKLYVRSDQEMVCIDMKK